MMRNEAKSGLPPRPRPRAEASTTRSRCVSLHSESVAWLETAGWLTAIAALCFAGASSIDPATRVAGKRRPYRVACKEPAGETRSSAATATLPLPATANMRKPSQPLPMRLEGELGCAAITQLGPDARWFRSTRTCPSTDPKPKRSIRCQSGEDQQLRKLKNVPVPQRNFHMRLCCERMACMCVRPCTSVCMCACVHVCICAYV